MRHQRDARRPELIIIFCAGNGFPEISRKLTVNHRDIDANLFKNPAMHQAHLSAAAIGTIPAFAVECAGTPGAKLAVTSCLFQSFKALADIIS